jgi:hypothetical protein
MTLWQNTNPAREEIAKKGGLSQEEKWSAGKGVIPF